MAHSLIISGGTVVDGSGAAPKRADVAVDDGRVSRIGDLSGAEASETIVADEQPISCPMPARFDPDLPPNRTEPLLPG